jgi:excisionase family DNA binding protein
VPALEIAKVLDFPAFRTKRRQMTMNLQSEWLTVAEAAQYLKIKPRTLLLWARQGKVMASVLSGTKRRVWRFRLADLDAALQQSNVLPSSTPSVRPAERMDR